MTNLPENENLNELSSAEISAEDELSTIFSDPTEHKKKAKENKKRKRWPIAVASLLAVAILVSGTVAVVKLIPEKEEEISSTGLEEITVLDMDTDDLSSVTVTNSNGTYKLYSEVTTEEAEEGEEATETVTWYLDGYAKDVVSTYSVSSTAGDAVSITASREITQKTAEECGLNSPVIKADVVPREGEAFSVLIGSDSPDNSGCYVKLSNSDTIYLADTSVKTYLEFDELTFANTDSLPGITLGDADSAYAAEDGTLTTFDSITVSGSNFSKPIVIEINDHELLSTYAPYKVTAPASRLANSDNISYVFSLFSSGVSVTGAYSYDTSAAALSKFGLDKPDFEVTMKAGTATQTFKFKLQEDGNYAAVHNGSKLIKAVAASSLTFINYKETDFYWPFVALNSIDDLKGFVYTNSTGSYHFTIAANEDEDAEDNYVITHNGEPIVCGIFQDFYQMCISLEACDYKTENIKGDPAFKFEFIFEDDKGGSNVIEFVKSSETRYEYRYDGTAMGRVTSSDLNKIEKALSKLLNGEEI